MSTRSCRMRAGRPSACTLSAMTPLLSAARSASSTVSACVRTACRRRAVWSSTHTAQLLSLRFTMEEAPATHQGQARSGCIVGQHVDQEGGLLEQRSVAGLDVALRVVRLRQGLLALTRAACIGGEDVSTPGQRAKRPMGLCAHARWVLTTPHPAARPAAAPGARAAGGARAWRAGRPAARPAAAAARPAARRPSRSSPSSWRRMLWHCAGSLSPAARARPCLVVPAISVTALSRGSERSGGAPAAASPLPQLALYLLLHARQQRPDHLLSITQAPSRCR